MKTSLVPLHLSLTYLSASGVWPVRYSLPTTQHKWWNSNILYNFYGAYILWHQTCATAQNFMALYALDLSFAEVIVCTCNGWAMLFTILKLYLFCARRSVLRRLVTCCREMHAKIRRSTSAEAHSIFRKRRRFTRFLSRTCFLVTMITSTGTWFGPYLDVALLRSAVSNSTQEQIFLERYGIPLIQYFPFNVKNHLVFCNIYEFLNCFVAGIVIAAPDVFIYSVMNILSAHYDVVYIMFSDLGQTSRQFEIDEHEDAKDANDAQIGLKKAVRHHISVIQLGKEVEAFCHPFMALQITMSAGVICMATYQMSKVSALYSPVFIILLQYFALGNVLTFAVCYFAQEARSKSMAVAFAAYNSDWLHEQRSFRREIALCIHQSQRNIRISALKAVNVSLDLFVNVVKQSYSLFALIQRVESL